MANKKDKLHRTLGLFDVFAISTGAMFSSGFFLLPGLAYEQTGTSVVWAYLIAGVLILPAMLSVAELSTALPKAGGAYYLIDRSLGPLIGTIGGIGTYLALLFKSAFALIGIGAYIALFYDMPIKPIAIIATLIFMAFNLFGAKETTGLQKFFVIVLVVTLGYFLIESFYYLHTHTDMNNESTFQLKNGIGGLFGTVGFVFVSYIGLTKVSSVAEEIQNPERNIPLGMTLSLVVTSLIYVLGVYIVIKVVDLNALSGILTPINTAGEKVIHWIPKTVGSIVIIAAAIAAFASTGNAGLMSASRYPLAMSRDKILPPLFSKVSGKSNTPRVAIALSSILMILFILLFKEQGIAKLAGSFQLVIFALLNFSVIVMRNSKIESYDPGYKTPLFPFIQVLGILISLTLIIYMGVLAIAFSLGIILIGFIWYKRKVEKKVARKGAIFHWFALLGKDRYNELEGEMLEVLREKGLRQGDPFDELIVESKIEFLTDGIWNFDKLLKHVSNELGEKTSVPENLLKEKFLEPASIDPTFILPQVAFMNARLPDVQKTHLLIAINEMGIRKEVIKNNIVSSDEIHVFFFLVSPEIDPRQQLRLLSGIANTVERSNFVKEILQFNNEQQVKEYLLHKDRFLSLTLDPNHPSAELIGKYLKEIRFPQGVLIALVNRNGNVFAPDGNTVLMPKDTLTIIGDMQGIKRVYEKYGLIKDISY